MLSRATLPPVRAPVPAYAPRTPPQVGAGHAFLVGPASGPLRSRRLPRKNGISTAFIRSTLAALALAACATLADRPPADRYETALTLAAETVTAYAAAESQRIDRLAPGPAREHAEAALTAVLDRYELAEAVAEAVLAAWHRGEASEADVARALARVAAAAQEAGL